MDYENDFGLLFLPFHDRNYLNVNCDCINLDTLNHLVDNTHQLKQFPPPILYKYSLLMMSIYVFIDLMDEYMDGFGGPCIYSYEVDETEGYCCLSKYNS